jgi:hypothetical protein
MRDMTSDGTEESRVALRGKLLDINTWAMLLIIALVLEQASGALVVITGASHAVDLKVWTALFMMGLVFGMLLGTTVGILALHVRFKAEYKYPYIILDNVFVTVPLYVAVRFIAASIGNTSSNPIILDDSPFRIGATMIGLSFVFLLIRDIIVLPSLRTKLSITPLVVVGVIHLVGAILFISLAVVPGFLVYGAVACTIGLAFFFAGMLGIPYVERRFPGADAAPGLSTTPARP